MAIFPEADRPADELELDEPLTNEAAPDVVDDDPDPPLVAVLVTSALLAVDVMMIVVS